MAIMRSRYEGSFSPTPSLTSKFIPGDRRDFSLAGRRMRTYLGGKLPARHSLAPADCTQGRLGQGRFRAVGLSSFRTYAARLSAGYSGFRSGENDSSLGKRRRFPYGARFPPTLLTSGRPVPPNRAPFSWTLPAASRERPAVAGDGNYP
jgi:hypothetical protein